MKKYYVILLSFTLLAVFTQCKDAKKDAEEAVEEMAGEADKVVKEVEEAVEVKAVQFPMEAKSDSGVEGVVNFTEKQGVVTMAATFSGLTPGEHAIHLHEEADCSAADGTSTGGHWNPTNEPHGKWGDDGGYHKGDIGNFEALEDGTAEVEFSTDQWCLDCDDPNKNIMGKAVIVHQGVDDFTSQPSGAAGARISCTGIIQQ